ncbi:hypothetical protein F4779DRAFT_621530 [Xylariaceae sp. FL0662B]|nr:hypothetical protein F4779DRAFT_621530 [Xylariaceae sp. FL0662B]
MSRPSESHYNNRFRQQTKTNEQVDSYELINTSREGLERPIKSPWGWNWEITTLSLSLILLAAQNTIIAVFTAFYKAAQMHAVGAAIGQIKWIDYKARSQRLENLELYDESSRGPHRAIMFLFRIRWGIATVGAFGTLLSLALDPFTQQIVSLQLRNVTTPDDHAVFGYALQYVSTRDPGIQGAIMKGVFGIKTAPEFQCSGSCTWDGVYRSIRFSSTCDNVTQAAAATKVCNNLGKNNETSESYHNCNVTTPGNVTLSTNYVLTDSATVLRVATTTSFYNDIDDTLETSARISPGFLKVGILRAIGGPNMNFNESNIMIGVTECSISVVMHEYQGIAANDSDFSISSHRKKRLDPGYPIIIFHNAFSPNSSVVFNQSDRVSIGQALSIGVYDWSNMVQFMSEIFSTHIIGGMSGNSQVGIGQAFWKADIPATFDSLTESMTDYLRSLSSGHNTQKATGRRVEQVVYVHVRFEWIILPIVIELTALLFVVLVIVSSRRHDIPAWKISALALLVHRCNTNDGTLTTDTRSTKEIKTIARGVYPRLE